jgi:hypothetical protein
MHADGDRPPRDQRLNVLIGDLLDYANPPAPQAVDFDLGVMVEETLQVGAWRERRPLGMAMAVDRPLPLHADPLPRQGLGTSCATRPTRRRAGPPRPRRRRTLGHDPVFPGDDGGIAPTSTRIFDPFYTKQGHGPRPRHPPRDRPERRPHRRVASPAGHADDVRCRATLQPPAATRCDPCARMGDYQIRYP